VWTALKATSQISASCSPCMTGTVSTVGYLPAWLTQFWIFRRERWVVDWVRYQVYLRIARCLACPLSTWTILALWK
jgi:hypothetical protein